MSPRTIALEDQKKLYDLCGFFFCFHAHRFLRGDGMNGVFSAMLLLGIIYAAATGHADVVQTALLEGGTQAVDFCLSMAGAYAFLGGLLGILRESGMAEAFSRALRKPMLRLFPFEPGEEKALDDICVNLAADMLGMGGASMPAGLSAMRTMADASPRKGRLSDAMALLLTMNMCSVQLLPTTMIALRAQAGAANPADIMLPTLISTAVSCAVGVGLCKLCAGGKKTRG